MPIPALHNKLLSLIPESHSYHVSKVYGGLYQYSPLAKINVHHIHSYYSKIKEELEMQDMDWRDKSPSLAHEIAELDYVFERLINWADNDMLTDNRDANVFLKAFTSYFQRFCEILKNIDNNQEESER